MNRTIKLIGGLLLTVGLLAFGPDGLAPAAQNGNGAAPQAAASPAAPAQATGRGMMSGGMAARHYQMHGAAGPNPCPCAENRTWMGPGMMSHPRMEPGMMGRPMGPGMMAGGMGAGMMRNLDPKTRGKIMQLRGRYMIEMGQLMEKRGKEIEAGK